MESFFVINSQNCFHGPNLFCRVDFDSSLGKELNRLLRMPVSHYNSLVTLLQLPHFAQVLHRLDYNGRKSIALHLVNNALDNETYITTQEHVRTYIN